MPSLELTNISMILTCPCGKTYFPSQSWIHRGHGVTNTETPSVTNKVPARVLKWREKNRDLYLERQREYMRKKRASDKDGG